MSRSDRHPVFIGVAWPYANGPLHLGHIAGSLLPPDIFARYNRLAGNDVLMVSGSDCHGTPIMLQAEKEGLEPAQVVGRFHAEHVRAMERLGIRFDCFTTTTTDNHRDHVQTIFTALLDQGLIEKRTQQAPYDVVAKRFLPDRYVEGTCPHCDFADARGDQCDSCGKTLDPQELRNPRSKLNPDSTIEFRDTDHYFFLLSKLQGELEGYVSNHRDHWRANTINFTQNWLREGLQDRAITRDLQWGIPIPLPDHGDKRIYVWFEAVCGYLTAAIEWAKRSSEGNWEGLEPGSHWPQDTRAKQLGGADAWQRWWTHPDVRSFYFLGKDNIPFHTIIWPGILTAYNKARQAAGEPALTLPYDVPANEFLNLGGEQFSKSRGIGIWVHEVLDRFQADAIRYYLAINMPEQRDADWTWDDFLAKVNDELVGTIGNYVHRTLSFTHKNLDAVPGPGASASHWAERAEALIELTGRDMAAHLDRVELKKAARRLLEFAGSCNQLMQEAAPWKLLKEDRAAGEAALNALLRLDKALAIYMAPFMPHAAERLWQMLGEKGSVHAAAWADAASPLAEGTALAQPEALFRKLDPKDIPGASAAEAATESPAATGASSAQEGKGASKSSGSSKAQGNSQSSAEAPANDAIVAFDDFARVQLRIARVTSVEDHPNADKLYVLRLDAGDLGERQVVAGLKAYYRPEELVGQTVAFVANLAPVKLRGVESQGMILAGDHDGTVSVLNPQRELPPGATIR